MGIFVDAATFRDIDNTWFTRLAGARRRFFNLSPADHQPGFYVLSISERPQSLVDVTFRLNTMVQQHMPLIIGEIDEKSKECRAKNYSNDTTEHTSHQEDVQRVVKGLTKLNQNVSCSRRDWCRWCLFFQTLFHRLPNHVEYMTVMEHTSKVSAIDTAPRTVLNIPRTQRGIVYGPLPFPLFSTALSSLNVRYVDPKLGYHQFTSLTGRLMCLWNAIIAIGRAVASPFLTLRAIYNNSNRYVDDPLCFSGCNKVDDSITAFVLSPVVEAATAVKCLFGAVFHPGIVFRAL